MNLSISKLHGREILDSRGNPTLEVELTLSNGSLGRSMIPSGASKGAREALELRDGDKKRYLGKGVLQAVRNVNEVLNAALAGRPIGDQKTLDLLLLEMDGTPQKSKLGGNTMLGVSLAFAHAFSHAVGRPLYRVLNEMMGLPPNQMRLPVPLMNIINGGVHADNGLAIQEFMIVPHGFDTFSSALRAGAEIFHTLKKSLHDKGLSTAVGDEGGFAPQLPSNESALEAICGAIQQAGYTLGKQVSVALDCAASSFYSQTSHKYQLCQGQPELDKSELCDFYGKLLEKFPLVSIEDGLDEEDWEGWKTLTKRFGNQAQLVGDDLFVTQAKWVKKGIDERIANAVLIKVNQVGTLTETFETMNLCRKNGYNCVVSHRSGETEDVTIAHLAVGSGCGQIKTGSASRSERMAKYNELLRIEEWANAEGRPIPFAQPFQK